MAHEQFFYSPLVQDNHIIIEGSEHQHLSRVLRKKTNDIIWISDGNGNAYEAKICSIEKEISQAEIMHKHPLFGEPGNKVSIAVGLIKPSHWEILLEKSVELGVSEIFPLLTQHTQYKHLKRERSEKIVLSAMKQSGRSCLPTIHEPIAYNKFLDIESKAEKFICDNQDNYSFLERGKTQGDYLVLIGPEGGFSSDEVNMAIKKDYKPILLSKRRLRTETACFNILSLLSR